MGCGASSPFVISVSQPHTSYTTSTPPRSQGSGRQARCIYTPSSAFTPPPLHPHFPHRGLAGKPGAARKALAALEAERQARREQEDAQKAQEAAEKVLDPSAGQDSVGGTSGFLEQPTLLDDDEDELLASLRPEEDEGEEGEGAAEEAVVAKAEGEE